MSISLKKISSLPAKESVILLTSKSEGWSDVELTKQEQAYLTNQIQKHEKTFLVINRLDKLVFVQYVKDKKEEHLTFETCRKAGADVQAQLNSNKLETISLVGDLNAKSTLAFIEGLSLSSYQFLKYRNNPSKEAFALKTVKVLNKNISNDQLAEVEILTIATSRARDLVNEPVNYLTAVQLGKEIEKLGKESGFKVEVLKKNRIEALKMGGLLSVNLGSIDPPTFSILEYTPKKKAKNKKPFVLVGKGVVYDTGGLSLKPTPNSMDMMKCDMAGAAAVACAMYAIAKTGLNVHVIGLIPATDNRPGENAYTPGDVITLHNGKTVEVLNTDAEGRLILGDALSYAQKYKPELVIDLATLTGAAHAAIGPYGIVAMGTASKEQKSSLTKSGNDVYERLVEFPFWEEYGDLIKSDVAEIKNIGGPVGGAITAGKFLEHFTNYPWIHLDIAGPAFSTVKDSYRGKGGTGVGVRLLYNFFKNISES